MEQMTLIQILVLSLGFYMAWNIGANDVANAMGTSVGSKALTLKRAVILAAILEFSGAYFVGSSVSETIQKGIVEPSIFQSDPMMFVYGMMGSLLATGVLLQLASYFGLPVSTTHAIVGAVLGFGICVGGPGAIHWPELGWIVSSWILSPVLSGIVSYTLFHLIQKQILFAFDPVGACQKLAPFFVFLCFSTASFSLLYQKMHLDLSLFAGCALACSIGLLAAWISRSFVIRMARPALQLQSGPHPASSPSYAGEISQILARVESPANPDKKLAPSAGVEKIFTILQIMSACLVAFAHGANDVANAIGPVAAVLHVLKHQALSIQSTVPSWLLALGGSGIVMGLATWGWRVIETIGKKITELTPTRGFSAEFGAAFTILLASKLGLPISTTHALIGAVLGVGLARGLKTLNLQVIKEIVISWIITIPLCALFSILAFYLLKFCFG